MQIQLNIPELPNLSFCCSRRYSDTFETFCRGYYHIQSTLVISNSKGLSEIFRDIRTSKYQICRIEENIIRTTTFNKYMYIIGLLKFGDILKILWNRGEIAPEEQFLLFSTMFFFYLLLDFDV